MTIDYSLSMTFPEDESFLVPAPIEAEVWPATVSSPFGPGRARMMTVPGTGEQGTDHLARPDVQTTGRLGDRGRDAPTGSRHPPGA